MPGLSELVTSTLRKRTGQLADNITNHNAFLRTLKRKGQIATAGGRTIVQEIEYAENGTVDWYSGYDTISTNTNDIMTAAEYDWKQLAGTIKFNGLEADVQNTGREQMISLVSSRMSNLEKTLMNEKARSVYADGTGSTGKELGGLQLLVADAPATGTVGGIDRAADAWWRNQFLSGAAEIGAAMDNTNINQAMNKLWLLLLRGSDKPDCIMADANFFTMYWEYLQEKQRITSTDQASAGFMSLKFMSADVYYDDQAPVDHMYFLNTDYLFLRYASQRNYKTLDDRAPTDVAGGTVDAIVRPVVWAGNMTMSNASLQGVLLA